MGQKTAEQVTEGVDASPLTIIVTGGTNGLGKETVRALAKRGAHVFLAARNISAAETVKEDILKETASARIDLLKVDLASLESVRTAAKEFLALNVPLNVLVCNAGMASTSSTIEYSVDGVELAFATNYLGHVLLTQLLLDKLKETARETGKEGRIVNVSSIGHEAFVHEEGIQFEAIQRSDKTKVNNGNFMSPFKNYGQSKLAQILYTKELAKRLQDEGVNVTVNSLHPGTVRTNITATTPFWMRPFLNLGFLLVGMTSKQGAGLQTYLAISPEVKGVTGKYFDNYKECPLKLKHALDEELQKKLWDFSMKLISA
ncbi:unnamed protein product [Calypogeia fissa]